MKGWWYYFPVAFALKTTIPFLLAAIAGVVWALFQLLMKKDNRFVWLLLPLAVYLALSMSSHINIGVRHILPAFSFLFIAAAVVLERLLQVKRLRYAGLVGVVVVFGWMSVEMVRTFPNYIPYMNQLAFSHPRWWYLSDSNVEWGDDAKLLSAYLHARGETEVRGVVAAGWGTLAHYGIRYYDITPRTGVTIPETRYVAIGASFLNGAPSAAIQDWNGKLLNDEQRVNFFDSYRHLQPEAILGNSIYVYRVK